MESKMDKNQILKMIDDHKNKLINPVELLGWTWLRFMIYNMTNEEWENLVERTAREMS